MTTRAVYRHWKLVPVALESLVLRIKWWQGIFRDPDNNVHLLSVLFGDMDWEASRAQRCPLPWMRRASSMMSGPSTPGQGS